MGPATSGTAWPPPWSNGSDMAGDRGRHGVPPLPAPDAPAPRGVAGPGRGRRGIRLRRPGPHGPPGTPRRGRSTDVRGLHRRHLAGRGHRSPPSRSSGALRPVPAPGGPGPSGGDPRPPLRRAVRARDRLGFDPGRAGGLRIPALDVVRAARAPGRDPRPGEAVLERGSRRSPGAALPGRGRPTAADAPVVHPHRGGRDRAVHHGPGGPVRRLVERPHAPARPAGHGPGRRRWGPDLGPGAGHPHHRRAQAGRGGRAGRTAVRPHGRGWATWWGARTNW